MAMSRTEPVSLDGIRAALRVAAEKFLRAVAKDHPSETLDRKSTRLNSSHSQISYAVFCLKKKIILSPVRPAFISALASVLLLFDAVRRLAAGHGCALMVGARKLQVPAAVAGALDLVRRCG